MIMHVVGLMRETVRLNLPDRHVLMVRQLEFFLRLLSQYRNRKLNESNVDKRISTQFHNDLVQHFREHRDVGFYAEKACLSPKHFSTVIKQETGHSATHWIHTHRGRGQDAAPHAARPLRASYSRHAWLQRTKRFQSLFQTGNGNVADGFPGTIKTKKSRSPNATAQIIVKVISVGSSIDSRPTYTADKPF